MNETRWRLRGGLPAIANVPKPMIMKESKPAARNSRPRADGFRMPGEFEPHQGCWMLWPERGDIWRRKAKPAQKVFAAVAAAISRFEPVSVGVSEKQLAAARRLLPGQIRLVELSSNDAWMRDVGPTFVVNDRTREIRGVDWQFNAWGGIEEGLYFPWDQDEQVARSVLEVEGMDRYPAPLIMEGGAIHVDGQGTLLTTESCLLNRNRNPKLSRRHVEEHLKSFLDVDRVIWIPTGVHLDETDGHVDNLCCFIRPGVVALSWTDDINDPNRNIAEAAFAILARAKDARGRSLAIHKIHQPGPLFITDEESSGLEYNQNTKPRKSGDRLAGSYINFYMANGGIVMPLFDDPHDAPAQQALQTLFPEREVVGLQTREILLGGGNIHCITQQVPAI